MWQEFAEGPTVVGRMNHAKRSLLRPRRSVVIFHLPRPRPGRPSLTAARERNGRLFLIALAVVPPCDRSGQSAFGKRVWGSWVETAAIRLSTAIWWS
jgi:hypothetical protein